MAHSPRGSESNGMSPLLVDPQGQGLQWLRAKEEPNGVRVSNFAEKHFPDHLRDQLRDGRPLLVENCTEDIDPMMDPVLEKVRLTNVYVYIYGIRR